MADKKKEEKIDWNAADEVSIDDAPRDEAARDGQTENAKKEKKSEIKNLKGELEEKKEELKKATEKARELEDKYLRTMAEYDNFRKRSQSERVSIYGEAVADALKGLLPIIDNLQIAQKYSGGDSEKIADGVKMILSKLSETLEKLDIKTFGEVGDTFDPELHNAVMHEDDDTKGENEITEVLQSGYMYKDKVIRYAMVKVAN